MNALALAIALSLLSAACYAAAAVAQERIAGHEARASWPTALALTASAPGCTSRPCRTGRSPCSSHWAPCPWSWQYRCGPPPTAAASRVTNGGERS